MAVGCGERLHIRRKTLDIGVAYSRLAAVTVVALTSVACSETRTPGVVQESDTARSTAASADWGQYEPTCDSAGTIAFTVRSSGVRSLTFKLVSSRRDTAIVLLSPFLIEGDLKGENRMFGWTGLEFYPSVIRLWQNARGPHYASDRAWPHSYSEPPTMLVLPPDATRTIKLDVAQRFGSAINDTAYYAEAVLTTGCLADLWNFAARRNLSREAFRKRLITDSLIVVDAIDLSQYEHSQNPDGKITAIVRDVFDSNNVWSGNLK